MAVCDDGEAVARLLQQLPRRKLEAVASVTKEAVQLLHVAPMVAGASPKVLASLLAPTFLWGGALERRHMNGRSPRAEVAFVSTALQNQLKELAAAYPEPAVALAEILGATTSAPSTPQKQPPQQRPQGVGTQAICR